MEIKSKDYHLVMGCLANDRKSQHKLYNKYASSMLGVCMRYANNTEDAEDMLIEGFMKIFIGLNNFRYDCTLEIWMYRIMINNALNYFRQNAKYYQTVQIIEESLIDESSASLDVPERISQKDLIKQIQKMPEHLRVVFNLVALDGYDYGTIAAQLSISENTIRSRFSKAKQFLYKQFYLQ